jgi:hypothetical protein
MAYIWLVIALIAVVAGVIAISRRRRVFDETEAPYEEESEAIDAALSPEAAAEPGTGGLGVRVRSLFSSGAADEQWPQLEDLLIRADVGPNASKEIVEHLKERVGQGADPEEALTVEISNCDVKLEQIAREQYPEVALLKQVSGVGNLIALTFVLTVEDASRFQKSRDVGCYIGLRPKRSESITAMGRAPMVKMSRRIPPTPVAAPWNGSMKLG